MPLGRKLAGKRNNLVIPAKEIVSREETLRAVGFARAFLNYDTASKAGACFFVPICWI
jgi:hypothetical protein